MTVCKFDLSLSSMGSFGSLTYTIPSESILKDAIDISTLVNDGAYGVPAGQCEGHNLKEVTITFICPRESFIEH